MSKNYTPKTEAEIQYEREYNRIMQAIRRQRKIGYSIPDLFAPTKPSKMEKITPKDVENIQHITPKFIRQHSYYVIESTGEAVYGKDVVKSHHTPHPSVAKVGSYVKKSKKQSEPKKSKKKKQSSKNSKAQPETQKEQKYSDRIPPKETNLNTQIIDDIRNLLDTFEPKGHWTDSMRARKIGIHAQLSAMFEDVLTAEGEYEVAYRLEQNASRLHDVTNRLLYESSKDYAETFDIGTFCEILFGKPLTQMESDYYSDLGYSASQQAIALF